MLLVFAHLATHISSDATPARTWPSHIAASPALAWPRPRHRDALFLGAEAANILDHIFHVASRSEGLPILLHPRQKLSTTSSHTVFSGPAVYCVSDDYEQGLSRPTGELQTSLTRTEQRTAQGPRAELQEKTCISAQGRTGALQDLAVKHAEVFHDF